MSDNNKNFRKTKVSQYYISFLRQGMIWILIIAIYISSCGCAPALLVGTAIAVDYIAEVEKQNRRAEAAQRKHLASEAQRHKSSKPPEPEKQETSERLIMESKIAYGTFQWDKAKRLLKEVLERETLSISLKWEALTILGAMEYQHGNTNEARDYFLKARKKSRTMTPSRELFPPQMIRFYKSVR